MKVTLESLWSVFEKHSFSQQISMILCNSGIKLCHFGFTLGSLKVYVDGFGLVLGYFGITLGSFGVYEGGFGVLLGHFGITLGLAGGPL